MPKFTAETASEATTVPPPRPTRWGNPKAPPGSSKDSPTLTHESTTKLTSRWTPPDGLPTKPPVTAPPLTGKAPSTHFEWSKSQLATPLNRMPTGKSTNWSESASTIRVDLPQYSRSSSRKTEHGDTLEHTRSLANITTHSRFGDIALSRPTPPTTSMVILGDRLRLIPPGDLKHSDFIFGQSNQGVSVLVAVLIEGIQARLQDWSATATYNLVHTLLLSASESLRGYFNEKGRLETLLTELEPTTDPMPPLREDIIHPSLFPSLIREQALVARRFEVDLNRQECMGIISPFIRRFYPLSAIRAIRALKHSPVSELVSMVQTPGFFAARWRDTDQQCIFDPPQWIDLRPPDRTPPIEQNSNLDDTSDVHSEMDGFSPIRLLGVPQETALAMHPDALRTKSLQTLPGILSKLIAPEETAQIIISIATSPPDTLSYLLSTDGFRATLNTIRGTLHPPPPTWVFRLRVHVDRSTRSWASHELLIATWAGAAHSLLKALGSSLHLLQNPQDQDEAPLLFTQDLGTTAFTGYAHPKTVSLDNSDVGTFDIWCCTSYEEWHAPQSTVPQTGSETASYLDFLTLHGLHTDCREKRPFGVFPCVALSGSDRRDNEKRLQDEYTNILATLEGDIPPFIVAWMSLRSSARHQSVMVKCIAATPEHFDTVTALFRRLETHTHYEPPYSTNCLHLHILGRSPTKEEIEEVHSSQLLFENCSTRIVLTGIPGLNPFCTELPPHVDAQGDDLQPRPIAHYIFDGGLNDDGEQLENPIIKLTHDSACTKFYLYAHHEDASVLIRCGSALRRLLTSRLGLDPGAIGVYTRDAEDFLPSRPHPADDSDPHVDHPIQPSAPSVTSMDNTMVHSMFQMLTDLRLEVSSLKEHLHLRPHIGHDEMISAVQSSITSTTTEIQTANRTNTEIFTTQLLAQVQQFTGNLGAICHELNAGHSQNQTVLQHLVDRYDATALDCYDSSLAYGNELVMLRLMVQACVDRVNLLIAGTDIPSTPYGTPPSLGPREMEMVIDEINNDYKSGVDMTRLGTGIDLPPDPNTPIHTNIDYTDPLPENGTNTNTLIATAPPFFPSGVGSSLDTSTHEDGRPPHPTSMATTPTTSPSPTIQTPRTKNVTQEETTTPSTTTASTALPLPHKLARRDAPPSRTTTPTENDTPTLSGHTSDGTPSSVKAKLETCFDCGVETPLEEYEECETCYHIFCSECICTELDRGLHWCRECRDSEAKPLTTTSLASDTSEVTPPSTHITPTTMIPTVPLSMLTRDGTQSIRSGSPSPSSHSLSSNGSSFSQKTTTRTRQRRRRYRSTSPTTRSYASKSTAITTTSSNFTPKRRSAQSTLDSFTTLRPRRANAKYTPHL